MNFIFSIISLSVLIIIAGFCDGIVTSGVDKCMHLVVLYRRRKVLYFCSTCSYSLATIIVADFATNGNAGFTPNCPAIGEAVQTEKRKTVSPVH